MAYQVIARKYRPQQFSHVVGQQAVTRTLQNALKSGRLAQSFVFAGPRGVGKTTTARILARALNCDKGPTAEPCDKCDACVEIAEGRDMDVLEIDAATHTGIDNVREVIVSGLAIRPARDRYKVFIIDEVHQLSPPSFNALLKSLEEPPPHVIFMMATTELDKIPDTVLSRSQVYEFRTISTKTIADTLREIAGKEGITVGDDSLHLIARDADGSMRDGQSKLDQVIAFTGKTITADDVSAVLGLVGRDLLLDTVQAVADEDAPQAFALAARAIEMGYDLRTVCRELARLTRDLLVLSVDLTRITDPEIAGEPERDRLTALVKRFSREDLLRAFDLLTKAEDEIRHAAVPRYNLEMALLRWIHLRKLVPLEDLIQGAGQAGTAGPAGRAGSAGGGQSAPIASVRPAHPAPPARPASASSDGGKDALLAAIRGAKAVFYNTVVAQAQKIEIAGDRVTFTFGPGQRMQRDSIEQNKAWLESVALQTSGRRMTVSAVLGDAPAAAAAPAAKPELDKKAALRQKALDDPDMKPMLEVFAVEIRDVEEM